MQSNEGRDDGKTNDKTPSHVAGLLTHHDVSHPIAEEYSNCDEELIECSCGSAHGSWEDGG